MRTLLSSLLLVAAIAVAPACAGGPGGPGKGAAVGKHGEDEKQADPRVLVETAAVEMGSVADHLATTGTLESEAQADIVPEATGIVTRVLVEEGDVVSAGQVLAELRNPSLEAGADRALVELERARREAERAEQLHGQGAISDRELREARTALQTAETGFGEASATAGFARIQSPISGTVAVRDLRVGELAGQRRAFQVVDLDRLRVIVQLPEKDLPRIGEGQRVELSGAYDDAASAVGVVERVSPVVDAQTGTVRVTIKVDAESSALRPGQFVKADIEVDRHDNVLTIPRAALVWEDGEPLAWKIGDAPPEEEPDDAKKGEGEAGEEGGGFLGGIFGGKDGEQADEKWDPWVGIARRSATKTPLTIGYTDTARVEVQAGLDVGDVVVTLGNDNLREDTLLKLPEDPAWPEPPEDGDEADGESGDKAAAAGTADEPEG